MSFVQTASRALNAAAVLWCALIVAACGGGDAGAPQSAPTMAAAGSALGGPPMRSHQAGAARALGDALLAARLRGGRDADRAQLDAIAPAVSSAATPPWRRTLSASRLAAESGFPVVTGEMLDAAEQLMAFGEELYPQWFHGPQATRWFEGYLYRHYPTTGVYLGVRAGEVYVLGGPFGDAVQAVGPLTRYITPQPVAASGLCRSAAQTEPAYVRAAPRPGASVALAVAGCRGTVAQPLWRQTGGPPLPLVSARTQAIGFNPAEPGDYTFLLSYVDAAGVARQRSLAFTVPAAAAAALALRTPHAVRMGGRVSVRAWPQLAADDAVETLHWDQIEGPAVTLDTSDDHVALFTAPSVTRDTLVRLRATLRSRQGVVASDEVAVLVERQVQAAKEDTSALWSGKHVERVVAYRADGRWAPLLARCTYDPGQIASGAGANMCTVGLLPFLGQETGGELPSVEQVMDRVLVSHDWLGRNFETFLRTHDTRGDFRRMMGSVTAIVLGAQIRPSFYYAATGAIYLDADNFWMNAEERDSVNEAPDYRGAFDSGLGYSTLWRYVRAGRSLFPFYDPRARVTRTIDAVRDEAASLLYHELGHALDYMPPSQLAALSRTRTVWENIWPRYNNFQLSSDRLQPLSSDALFSLARIKYRGAGATPQLQALSALDVAAAFEADAATDDYAYTSPTEDLAMLTEELLMARRQDVQRDVAFSGRFDAGASSSTIIVQWGQRGRIGHPPIQARAQQVATALLPWLDPGEVAQLPPPTALRAGASWRDNLSPQLSVRHALAGSTGPGFEERLPRPRGLHPAAMARCGSDRPLPPPPEGSSFGPRRSGAIRR